MTWVGRSQVIRAQCLGGDFFPVQQRACSEAAFFPLCVELGDISLVVNQCHVSYLDYICQVPLYLLCICLCVEHCARTILFNLHNPAGQAHRHGTSLEAEMKATEGVEGRRG